MKRIMNLLAKVTYEQALVFLLAIAASFFIKYVLQVYHNISFPFQIDFGESYNMYVAQLWHSGEFNWYADKVPYIPLIYPPVFYMVASPLLDHVSNILLAGRAIELVSTIGISILLFFIGHHVTKNKYLALAGALLIYAYPALRDWSFLAKTDMLALFFSLAGVLIVLKAKGVWTFASIPLFILAFFTKQNILAGASGVCLYLIIKNWRLGLGYSFFLIGGVLATIVIGDDLTGNQFHKHLLDYTTMSPYFKPAINIINGALLTHYPILLQITLSGIYVYKCWRSKDFNLLSLCLVTGLLIDIAMSGRIGGSINYQLEIGILATLGSVVMFQYMFSKKLVFFYLIIVVTGALSFIPMPTQRYLNNALEAQKWVSNSQEGIILSENFSIVLGLNLEPFTEPMIYNHVKNPPWDKSLLLQAIKERKFDYIITEQELPTGKSERWTLEQQGAILKNYEKVAYLDTYPDPTDEWFDYDFCIYKRK